ncbi:hypothetical protein NUW54_g4598 [Trametes sanguinea]|uniref:Uncharacterized protein n=1 Tax=Trametes sanguinea TaxID=158606 RepID=A0ACC1PZB9_9APHY|nr:hypothetical protein NUW54_g4598 [Trametes sanguinea]
MSEFRHLLDGADFPELKRRILVCQALIKCADISNPSRPYLVSQHCDRTGVGMEQPAAAREAPAASAVRQAVG